MKKNYTTVLTIVLCAVLILFVSPVEAQNHEKHYECSRQQVRELVGSVDPGYLPANEFLSYSKSGSKSKSQAMRFSDWYGVNGNALVTKLKKSTDYSTELKSLFDFDESYGKYIFSSRNVESVARAMYYISISHNGDYTSGMYGLVFYLHAATYHEFYEKSIHIDDNAMTWYEYACLSFTQNAKLYDLKPEALNILSEFLIMVDNDKIRHKPVVVDMIKKVMSNLVQVKNWKSLVKKPKVLRTYSVMANRIFFYMFRGIGKEELKKGEKKRKSKELVNVIAKDPNFINLVSQIALDKEIGENKKLKFLQNNAIGELVRAASEKKLVPLLEKHLVAISRKYKRLDVRRLKCVEALNKYCNCAKYDLCRDMTALRKELDDKLFTHIWSFDNGKMLIKTPLSYQEVEPLYYAAKEVEAQMYRILQTDKSVLDDKNVTLNMVVYGTLSDYSEYQTFLNNLSSDNGGMYIEKDATFYTYQRTEQESVYSLEELFRHEYTHYLQGRYIENGFWGDTDFFKKARLTWFEEGMAEFMAGSTSSDGIRFRRSMMNNIKRDGANRMPVSETIGANYSSGFKFYRYSYMIWLYLYHNQYQDMKILMDLIKKDDISAFDRKVNTLKNSSAFQRNVDTFITNSIAKTEDWWVPTTAYLSHDLLNVKSLKDIATEFKRITGIKNISVVSDASTSIARFGIKGKLTSGRFNQELDQIIKKLNEDKYINNFDFLVGYYKNVNRNTADFYITGSLKDKNSSDTAVCDFEISSRVGIIGKEIVVTSTSTGYINAYLWVAQGGYVLSEKNNTTKIRFDKAGTYNISLEIKDNNSRKYSKTITNAIEIFDKSNTKYCIPKTSDSYAHIKSVKFAEIENKNDMFNTDGYIHFSDQLGVLEKGKSNNLIVDNSYKMKSSRTKAWIDWNQDGTFDASEKVMDKSGKLVPQVVVTTPMDAITGVTRMRIRYMLSKNLDPCKDNSYIGETHDYTLIVKGSSLYKDALSASVASNISSNSAHLNRTAGTDNTSVSNYLDYSKDVSFKAYPNPCVDNIILEMSKEYVDADISILNSLGMIVFKTKIKGLNAVLNMSSFPRGVYVISIKSGANMTSKHVVKK